ncbi:MAG: hypothetical protein H6925_04750 [Holosporaceae bacterium]|nr:MAG: hypothetical protein H6925_04750 [Holosporaceae bacterium]
MMNTKYKHIDRKHHDTPFQHPLLFAALLTLTALKPTRTWVNRWRPKNPVVANPPPPHQVQAAQQQVFEEEDAHLAAQEAEEKEKKENALSAPMQRSVKPLVTSARVAQALGVTPGRDLTDLASGKKKGAWKRCAERRERSKKLFRW